LRRSLAFQFIKEGQLPSKQTPHQSGGLVVPALQLQTSPPVYAAALSGKWLLNHTTPSWRIEDPIQGFQRIVNEERAKQIARTVLDRERAFPNAITLASDIKDLQRSGDNLILPEKARFLVVDGQHRLWAQRFSTRDAQYACIIHLNKAEKEMAELFLEINDNQRRVPSSLRWDLVRLVKPEGDEASIMASELVFALVERQDSPFYYAIDLTGEKKDVSVKQGSLAPEIKTLITRTRKVPNNGFEEYATLLIRFFSAVRSLDPKGWGDTSSTYYKARVLRALIRVLIDIVLGANTISGLPAAAFLELLKKIDPATLSEEKIRAAQGSAGVTDLYEAMKEQVFA
jgi:DGQHR domain-containing protein